MYKIVNSWENAPSQQNSKQKSIVKTNSTNSEDKNLEDQLDEARSVIFIIASQDELS